MTVMYHKGHNQTDCFFFSLSRLSLVVFRFFMLHGELSENEKVHVEVEHKLTHVYVSEATSIWKQNIRPHNIQNKLSSWNQFRCDDQQHTYIQLATIKAIFSDCFHRKSTTICIELPILYIMAAFKIALGTHFCGLLEKYKSKFLLLYISHVSIKTKTRNNTKRSITQLEFRLEQDLNHQNDEHVPYALRPETIHAATATHALCIPFNVYTISPNIFNLNEMKFQTVSKCLSKFKPLFPHLHSSYSLSGCSNLYVCELIDKDRK